jgi:hypothetical protein
MPVEVIAEVLTIRDEELEGRELSVATTRGAAENRPAGKVTFTSTEEAEEKTKLSDPVARAVATLGAVMLPTTTRASSVLRVLAAER